MLFQNIGKYIGKEILEYRYRCNKISATGQISVKKIENIGIGFKLSVGL